MRADCLIVGANGQDGYYLNKLYLSQGRQVIRLCRKNDEHGLACIAGDIADFEFVSAVIRQHRPQHIYHLAAKSTTRHEAIIDNYHSVCLGTCNILEAVKRFSPDSRVFVTGSGLQFRNVGNPLSEHDPFVYDSAYALVRNSSVECARYYRTLGLAVYVGYLFHHESPRRNPTHVSRMIAMAARRAAEGGADVLQIGNVSVRKEWAYAGDIVNGMQVLLSQDRIFEATIGTGIGYTIEDWLTACFSEMQLDWHDHVVVQDGFVPEYLSLVSAPATMLKLGWKTRVAFQELAHLMMHPEAEV